MEAAMTAQNQTTAKPESRSGCLSVLVRLAWIFGGSLLLFFAFYVAQDKASGRADIFFWTFTVALILVRFLDIRFFSAETMDNKPATIKHWSRYSILLLIVSAVLYALAKIIAHFGWV
jgi:hypothetical protein